MKQQATFVGWEFGNTWGIVENVSYPYLQWSVSQPVTSIQLLPQSDTGISDSDKITNKDNCSSDNTLWFRVFSTVPKATVILSFGGQSIGSAVAGSTSTVIETNSSVDDLAFPNPRTGRHGQYRDAQGGRHNEWDMHCGECEMR